MKLYVGEDFIKWKTLRFRGKLCFNIFFSGFWFCRALCATGKGQLGGGNLGG